MDVRNQFQKSTNGRALVPGLTPWLANRIELDGAELPMDVQTGELVKEVVPHSRSGAIVRFDLRRSRQALVLLRQADGREVPAGARVTTLPQQTTFVVGQRGEAWLTDLLEKDQRVRVEWTGGGCELALPARDPNDVAPNVGPLSCKEGVL
ncbi:MAG: FimD/PapC C-terminal domain-containing protein [Pseudomonadota bacterium]